MLIIHSFFFNFSIHKQLDRINYLDHSWTAQSKVICKTGGTMPESTINIFLGALMGIIGGLISTPLNAIFSWYLKQEEISYQHRLDLILKKRELFWQHHLENTNAGRVVNEIASINAKISLLENKLRNVEINDLPHLQKSVYDSNEKFRQVGIVIKNINQQIYDIEKKVVNKGH